MKIDLQEINGIIADIMFDYDEAVIDNEDLSAKSWGCENGQLFSHEKAKKIADALGQLHKLMVALQYSNRMLIQASKRFGDDEFYDRTFIKQALEPFTTKQQENG